MVRRHLIASGRPPSSVTSGILGTAIQQKRLALDNRLSSFFPESLRTNKNQYERFYESIQVSDLLVMGANFDWNEDYDGDIKTSSVLPMLYLSGYKDMVAFSANALMRPEGPGNRWIYSGGDANLIMGILHKIYGADYPTMPWRNLFDPIGMKSVVFEQDGAENYVGSSYVHASPRDMARFGFLSQRRHLGR